MPADPAHVALLRLTLTPGLGPTLIARLLERFGSPEAALGASPALLAEVRGIGRGRSAELAGAMGDSADDARRELDRCDAAGVRIVARDDAGYPPLLRAVPDAPPILYLRGSFAGAGADAYPVAIVGSRRCSHYGLEQAELFAGVLARSGLTIVSGGARGIDTAAHRGALRSDGRTAVVLGCGLGHCYPPENAELFDRAAERGCVLSELPFDSPPQAENFPARNRLISGMALGVLVIEAAERSGALITARMAAEEHGREVMALPGRVDAPTSAGTNGLIRAGGAALVTSPADVLETLRPAADHRHGGTFEARYSLFEPEAEPAQAPAAAALGSASPEHERILAALAEPMTPDALARATGLSASALRAAITLLEIQGRVRRQGSLLARRSEDPKKTQQPG